MPSNGAAPQTAEALKQAQPSNKKHQSMITVAEAEAIILEHAVDFGIEEIPLAQATGRVLREDLVADRDFPPFARVMMDGIAIRYEIFADGRREFAVEGIQAAGVARQALSDPAKCFEVMTGAPLPEGTDTVIRYEDLAIEEGVANIRIESIRLAQNVHSQGFDRKEGALIVTAGRMISPAETGLAATVGKAVLAVSRSPRTVIIYTGDEIVGVEQTPLPYQIRASNVHAIKAILARQHVEADTLHLPDDKAQTLQMLDSCLTGYDLIVLSGGVSMGKFDYIPEALEELGVERLFYKVRQRPGKPFWFGRSDRGATVFALPGNPVSAFMCALRYVQPWLRKCLGAPAAGPLYAMLAEDFEFEPDLTHFLQVKITCDDRGRLMARPVKGKGSGDLANLVDTDGFLELPFESSLFRRGEVFPLILFRNLF
jgi:molybdopterin molybdotransferase